MVSEALVVHRTPARLRLKIPGRRSDADYFARLSRLLESQGGYRSVTPHPRSASVLIRDERATPETLSELGELSGMFRLKDAPPMPVGRRVIAPLSDMNGRVRRFTGGDLDLKNLVFVSLLGIGLIQVLRGNLRLPPWYTAFWYSSGVFSKYLMDKSSERES
jgi:hypothetical protein